MRNSYKNRNSYENVFIKKIEHFKEYPNYENLKTNADWCLNNHTGLGYNQIVAADFMDRIIAMPLSYISDWLNGKNELQWRPEDIDMIGKIRKNGFKKYS